MVEGRATNSSEGSKSEMRLTKTEVRDIQATYKTFDPSKVEDGKGRTFYIVLIISRGRKNIHSSGYPWIQAIGVSQKFGFYDLGKHDSISLNYDSFGIDSLGKNVFQIWPKGKVGNLKTPEYFLPISDLNICDNTGVTPINTVM